MQPNTIYASYLLRLRQVQDNGRAVWVASLQSTVSGELRSFPSVEALVRFLETEYGGCKTADESYALRMTNRGSIDVL